MKKMDLNFMNCCCSFQNLLNENKEWADSTWSEEKTEVEFPCSIAEQKICPRGLAIGCSFLFMHSNEQLTN